MSLDTFRRCQAIRDTSEHPDFFRGESDAQLDRAVSDAAKDGDAMLKFTPAQLLRAIAEVCEDAGCDDAARELLRPLYSQTQGYLLRELHAATQDHPAVLAVAELAIHADIKHMRGN